MKRNYHPEATSTPTSFPTIRGRKGLREHDSIQSPIESQGIRSKDLSPTRASSRSPRASPLIHKRSSPRNASYSESDLYEESDELVPESLDVQNTRESSSPDFKQHGTFTFIGIAFLVMVGCMLALYCVGEKPENETNTSPKTLSQRFETLEKIFNKQKEDFWRTIRVNIQDINEQDQPRTILFLYESKAEATMNAILNNVAEAAICNLTECSNKPVNIQGSSLNMPEVISDYGKIISQYRNTLKTNGVMIVKNLEKVPGTSAQIFHSFSDEYNPVVKKALILITMKVGLLPRGNPTSFVEELLLNLWKDIDKDEKFYPLFTRISGAILPVQFE